MAGMDANTQQQAPPVMSAKPSPTVAQDWSSRTGLPARMYNRSKEHSESGDKSKGVDKHGRATHTKDGDTILRFR
jgi:hypothetical protein